MHDDCTFERATSTYDDRLEHFMWLNFATSHQKR